LFEASVKHRKGGRSSEASSGLRVLVFLLAEFGVGTVALDALRPFLFLGFLVLVLHGPAEALQCSAEVAADRLEPLRAEDQHDDQEHDQQLPDTDVADHRFAPSSVAPPGPNVLMIRERFKRRFPAPRPTRTSPGRR